MSTISTKNSVMETSFLCVPTLLSISLLATQLCPLAKQFKKKVLEYLNHKLRNKTNIFLRFSAIMTSYSSKNNENIFKMLGKIRNGAPTTKHT